MCANTDKGFGVLVFWYVPGRGSGLSGSGFRFKFAFRVRGFGSTAAQGFKVQSAVLAAQGLGFGVWGLGLKVQGSGFKGSGFRLRFSWAGFRLLGREPGQSRLRVQGWGFGLQTKADKARQWTFYEAKQPIDNFIARRPFYRSIVLPVDHFIAPNGRFIKANKRFYQAKAARRPFYRP